MSTRATARTQTDSTGRRRLSVYVDPDLADWFDDEAADLQASRSYLMEIALKSLRHSLTEAAAEVDPEPRPERTARLKATGRPTPPNRPWR